MILIGIILTVISMMPEHWSGSLPVEGITSLEIDNPLGKIQVVSVEGNTISAQADVIEYEKIKTLPKFDQAKIDFWQDGKKGILRLDIPKELNITNPPRVNFTVKVPANLVCNISAVMDDVEIRGSSVANTVSLVSGDILVTSPRTLGLYECVNGSITIDATEPQNSGTLMLRTVNGSINVHLPKGSIVSYKTDVIHGSVMLPESAKASMEASQRATIQAETINGNIEVTEVESLK